MTDIIARTLAGGLRTIAVVPRVTLTATEAAQALGVSRYYFDEHVAGDVRWICRGRKRLVALRELETWAERNGTLDEEPS